MRNIKLAKEMAPGQPGVTRKGPSKAGHIRSSRGGVEEMIDGHYLVGLANGLAFGFCLGAIFLILIKRPCDKCAARSAVKYTMEETLFEKAAVEALRK